MKKLLFTFLMITFCNFSNIILSQQNQRQTLAQIKIPVQFQTHPEFLKLELENCPTNIELIQYRTADQRTFLDIEGNYHTQKTGGYYNYLKESQWISIQEKLSFNQNLNSIGIFESELPITINKNSSSTKLVLEKNTSKGLEFGQNAALSFLSDNFQILSSIQKNNQLGSIEFNDNSLTVKDYFQGIDREQTINYWSVRTNYAIQTPLSIPNSSSYIELKDKLNLDPSFTISYGEGIQTTLGWLGTLKITNQEGEVVGQISSAQIFDSFESTNKTEVANHITPGYYVINQTENGIELILRFNADYLRRTDLVYPVIIDPTATNTYANNQGLQDKNTQYNANCEATLSVTVPLNFYVVTGTNTTYRIWAKGYIAVAGGTTNYADKVEQRSKVGSITWTATQNGSGTNHQGSGYTYTAANNGQTYTINNSNIANSCYTTNTVVYRWQGYQTFFPFGSGLTNVAGCVLNYQELVTNTWQVTTTYSDGPTINPVTSQTLCGGQQTTAVAFSGTGSSYTWTNSNTAIGLGASGTGTINAFTATNTSGATISATITVTPMLNGCAGPPTTFTITVSPQIVPTFTQLGPYCQNSTPAILPTTSTNTPSITGTWAPTTINTSTVGNLTYTFTPSANQCGATTTMVINIISQPTLTITPQTICLGQSGTLTTTVSPTGGSYLWSNNATSSSITESPTVTTSYTVGYSVSGCNATATSSITVNPMVNPTFTQLGPYCQNETPGTLTGTSTNGIDGTWNPSIISTASVGNQTYTFTPMAGICANSASMTITINPLLTPTFGTFGPYCQNENAPTLPGNSTNSPSIAGTWSPSVINTSTVGTTNYTFTPSISACTGNAVIPIIVQLAPSPQVNSDITQGCNPLSVNLSSPNLPNANYTWTANGTIIGTGSNLSATFTSAGCYDIELIATYNGCVASSSIIDYICVENVPTTFFNNFPTEVSENTESINFYNTTNGAVTYSWDFGDGTNSTLFEPNHQFTNINSNLQVTLTATSSFGCSSSFTSVIPFKDPAIFYVPNTFTPDEDEFNQTWGPVFTRGFDPHNFSLYVYDRWGELVWESHNAENQWDGTYGLSGKKAAQGVYIWRINYKPKETDDKVTISGHINLLR